MCQIKLLCAKPIPPPPKQLKKPGKRQAQVIVIALYPSSEVYLLKLGSNKMTFFLGNPCLCANSEIYVPNFCFMCQKSFLCAGFKALCAKPIPPPPKQLKKPGERQAKVIVIALYPSSEVYLLKLGSNKMTFFLGNPWLCADSKIYVPNI